jgi:hypothetical protein
MTSTASNPSSTTNYCRTGSFFDTALCNITVQFIETHSNIFLTLCDVQ